MIEIPPELGLELREVTKFHLEHTEGLLSGLGPLSLMSDNIELHSLGQRTALSNGNNITLLNSKAWGAVSMNVLVTLLETTVLLDVVKVIPTDNNSALHLGRDDKSLQDLTTDGNISGEGALLVDVGSLNGSIGGLDTQTNVLYPAHGLDLLGVYIALTGDENGILGLVGPFVLYREPPPHDNGAHDVNHRFAHHFVWEREELEFMYKKNGTFMALCMVDTNQCIENVWLKSASLNAQHTNPPKHSSIYPLCI